MIQRTPSRPDAVDNSSLARRQFLRAAIAIGAAVTAPPSITLAEEDWEKGNPLCSVPVEEVAPPYALDDALHAGFMSTSELLTGVNPLDPNLGRHYMERYAAHPLLTDLLPKLINSYRDMSLADVSPRSETDVAARIMQDATLRPAAEQLIYLWYVSAFFFPLRDNPTRGVWVYGAPEHYERGLLWSVIRAHAPMTPGGATGYWAEAPKS